MYDSLQPLRRERTRTHSKAKANSEPLWLFFTQSRYEKSVSNIGVEKPIVESTCLGVRRSDASSSCSTARSWDSNAYATSSYGDTPHSPWQECLAGIADSMAHVCIGTPKLFTELNGSLPDPEDPMDDQRHSSDKLHVVRKRVRPPRVRAKPDLWTQRSREVLHPPRDISRLGSDIHGTSSSPKRSDKMASRRGTHHTSA